MMMENQVQVTDAGNRLGIKNKPIDQDYVLGEVIGEGGSATVRLCQSNINGLKFACKTIAKDQEQLDDEDKDLEASIHREVELMQFLHGHPGIVNLEAVYEDSESFHLVMELVSGGDMFDQMVKEWPCTEFRSASMIKELMVICKYCHEKGVMHRDIKPENILITPSGSLKLADFGLATRFTKGQIFSSLLGSSPYIAPEVLAENYSEKADIWSVGILLHGMLVGSLPFWGDSPEVLDAIENANLSFDGKKWESISKPAKDLISKMLIRDMSLRFSAEEILNHPWILLHTEELKETSVDESLGLAISHARIKELEQTQLFAASREIIYDFSSSGNANNTLCAAF